MHTAWRIEAVETVADLATIRALFEAYAASLDIDLGYQGFADELRSLPGAYAPPGGALRLARDAGGSPVGCVALRASSAGRAEIKRLYVTPAGRGGGLGRALAEATIADARRLSYRRIVLDTLPSMTGAQALYRSLGFAEIEPYYDTPISGTIFMGLTLTSERD